MKKGNRKKKFLTILILFIIWVIARNYYYEYKFRNIDNDKVSKQENSITTTEADEINLNHLAKSNQNIAIIMKNKDKYPQILLEMLSRNLDMTDYVLGYEENKGQVYSNKIGSVMKGEYPLLLQYDKRWGYAMYGDDTIAINGCGPTSIAIIIAGLTGINGITPYDVATYSYNNGYYQSGTSWSFFTEGVKYFGITGTELPLSKSKMISELKNGHPIICSMGKGDFTTTGHIIAITGLKNNKFIIRDPNSKTRSSEVWSYERLEPQIKNLWSYQANGVNNNNY